MEYGKVEYLELIETFAPMNALIQVTLFGKTISFPEDGNLVISEQRYLGMVAS